MPVEITWLGHSCFRLRDRAATVVTDPYGKDIGLILPRVRADIVTISHDVDDHNYVKGVKGDFRVLAGPGEYEVSSVFVTGLELRGSKKKEVAVGPRNVQFHNTNRLVTDPSWDIGLQKTGYIAAAGRCLVMQAQLAGRRLTMVLLDSAGKYSRLGDAERIRQWLSQSAVAARAAVNSPPQASIR